ncbi:MAG: sugar transferase [Prochlorococcus marinus XMU1422]|nr:sugar transferase [Prochlorococcus marinus XMU1421]MBO7013233.1 sugar transferase [Prochlorococcus marinus XMU1422]MCR8542312.1 sugar transferase [Prochlorococcus marinus XMU1423]
MKNKSIKNKNLNIYRLCKNLFDFLFALIFIILGSPFFLVIAILVKFSSRGPIFFLQKRIGKNLKTFNCIKFRTMHPEAEDILENLIRTNQYLRKEFEETQKLKNDPRITNIGKFLRKTSLDEIPQFLNVLKMEMSIVGPRPIVKEEIKRYGKSFSKVISIRPGITGLWQVSGRNNLSYKKRVLLDCLYAQNVNLLMDIRIIIRTIGVIFFPNDRGAY